MVAQKGAREHFLAARALHQQGSLASLVLDWYAPAGRLARTVLAWLLGSSGRSALAARTDHIPDQLVRQLRWVGLWCKWKEREARRHRDHYAGFLATDAAFGRAVARMKLPAHDVFFGYSYASLEMLEAERARGVFTVLDQIDPGPVHFRLVAEETARHPELAGPPASFPAAYYARLQREWELADVIVVNSEWSREAIVAEGADSAKIEILPLAYQTEGRGQRAEGRGQRAEDGGQRAEGRGQRSEIRGQRAEDRHLRVLWLGQVTVGKGIHYLLEAARQLQQEAVEFTIAGPLHIRKEVLDTAPANVRWLGQVPRSQVGELYAQADLFVFPTLSDGFGLTQLEALAHGLPVIATPNCGRIVQQGLTGFIVPPRDAKALADAILKFVRNRKLPDEMRPRCLEAVKAFSVSRYGDRLLEIVAERMA